jgi:hypothetical protein
MQLLFFPHSATRKKGYLLSFTTVKPFPSANGAARQVPKDDNFHTRYQHLRRLLPSYGVKSDPKWPDGREKKRSRHRTSQDTQHTKWVSNQPWCFSTSARPFRRSAEISSTSRWTRRITRSTRLFSSSIASWHLQPCVLMTRRHTSSQRAASSRAPALPATDSPHYLA